MKFNKIYSAPTLSILLKKYLISDISVRYTGSKQVDRSVYRHCFELVYNAAPLYEVDLFIVNSKAYLSFGVPNLVKEEKEIESFDLEEVNQEDLIINTLVKICYDLNVRIFK